MNSTWASVSVTMIRSTKFCTLHRLFDKQPPLFVLPQSLGRSQGQGTADLSQVHVTLVAQVKTLDQIIVPGFHGHNMPPPQADNTITYSTTIAIGGVSSGEENTLLKPLRRLSLEAALEHIEDDELVEVTPTQIRVRKSLLKKNDRKRESRKRA